MGAIRSLYTDLRLRATDAVKGLKAYDKLWKAVAASVDASATSIERAADRASSALARIAEGASVVRSAVPRAGGAPSSAPARAPSSKAPRRAGPDPLDKAIRAANIGEAGRAGLAAGSVAIKEATAALGPLATKADIAKAKIADLTAQVERNRKEQADLKRQTIETGDAEGKLAARSAGLAAANKDVAISLGQARRNLSEVRGGLIETIRSAADLTAKWGVMKVAMGNMVSNAATAGLRAVSDGLQGAASSAIKFESGMADVAKVVDGLKTPTGEVTAEYTKMESKVLELSKTIAGPGAEGFAKIYAAAGEAGIAKQDLDQFAESAAKVSVAFGVTAEEAGSGMAKMRSGLGLTQDEVESLAGTMNYLSNNMAVTAEQAMEVVLASGGVGKAANVSGQEVAGLGAAMIASGAASDVAATASKNYILAMAAGTTATTRQRSAFQALGMDAEDVAKRFTGSAAERLKVQQELLSKIGKLNDAERVSTLSNLFGKESLGAISGITGDVDKFTKSMEMATDATAAASSVQNEYNVRSKTSENAVALLKANIEALAIKFGQALLPYINKIVAFLTSKEGQEWGAKAVEKAVSVVTGLADALGVVGGILSGLIEALGGTGIAVAGLGLAVASLAGPWGLAAAAAGAAIAVMTSGITSLIDKYIPAARDSISGLFTDVVELDKKRRDEEGRNKDVEDDLNKRTSINNGPSFGMGPAPMAKPLPGSKGQTKDERAAAGADKQARFDEISKLVRSGHKLAPSVAKEYTLLSKELDEAKASKARKGRTHKATNMDKQLAAMDPSVRALVTRGGDEDAGGDSMVAGNALDRAVLDRSSKSKGLGGVDGMGGVGPGPNINNTYVNINTEVNNAIDARSTAPISDNIRSASQDLGVRLGQVIVTGGEKLIAARNAGGVMRGPAA